MRTYRYIDFAYDADEGGEAGDGMVMAGEFEDRPVLTWDVVNAVGAWRFDGYVLPGSTVQNCIGVIGADNTLQAQGASHE